MLNVASGDSIALCRCHSLEVIGTVQYGRLTVTLHKVESRANARCAHPVHASDIGRSIAIAQQHAKVHANQDACRHHSDTTTTLSTCLFHPARALDVPGLFSKKLAPLFCTENERDLGEFAGTTQLCHFESLQTYIVAAPLCFLSPQNRRIRREACKPKAGLRCFPMPSSAASAAARRSGPVPGGS